MILNAFSWCLWLANFYQKYLLLSGKFINKNDDFVYIKTIPQTGCKPGEEWALPGYSSPRHATWVASLRPNEVMEPVSSEQNFSLDLFPFQITINADEVVKMMKWSRRSRGQDILRAEHRLLHLEFVYWCTMALLWKLMAK